MQRRNPSLSSENTDTILALTDPTIPPRNSLRRRSFAQNQRYVHVFPLRITDLIVLIANKLAALIESRFIQAPAEISIRQEPNPEQWRGLEWLMPFFSALRTLTKIDS